jgi:hypothetical protein
MAAGGVYRARRSDPVSVDGLWRQIRRQERIRRSLPVVVGLLALTPALAIAFSFAPESCRYVRHAFAAESATPQHQWGFVVSADAVRAWAGELPASAQRPSADESPIAVQSLQAAVFAHAETLRSCYARALVREPELRGTVVASLLIRRDGTVDAVVGGDANLRRTQVRGCVEGVLERLSFPAPDPDYGWVHLPLRFEPPLESPRVVFRLARAQRRAQ